MSTVINSHVDPRPVVEAVTVSENKFLSRMLMDAIGCRVEPADSPDVRLIFVTYSTSESTMNYSSALLNCAQLVDDKFNELVTSLFRDVIPTGKGLYFDGNGRCSDDAVHAVLHVNDVIDVLSDSQLFSTLQLGCCQTYSHHIFKTHCLARLLVTWLPGIEQDKIFERIIARVRENG